MQMRVKEEHQKLLKKASFIAREVMRFWTKAHQVVKYKHQAHIEAAKKEKMDKQLDLLVGQSEKCVTLVQGTSVHHTNLPPRITPIVLCASH